MIRVRRQLTVAVALCAVVGLLAGSAAQAHNEGIPSVPLSQTNITHVQNIPNLSGNALDFFERKLDDGTRKRYAVAATQGNGFDILDVTEPAHPTTVGRYVGPGTNYHAWVTVNPRRNIVALTIEDPGGRALRHSGAAGIQFVDISDVTNPVELGRVDGVGGPHTVRMIGDNHAYTSLDTWIVDYTDPMEPQARRAPEIQGHEFYEDPNHPGRGYAGMATSVGSFGIMDLTDPANPTVPHQFPDLKISAAHEVFPAPDSSFVGVADFRTGLFETACPGGGIHFYDISGKYEPGASLSNPKKMGTWFAPFTGASSDPTSTQPNYASCTMHSWQMHPERMLALGGLYAGGTWVFDPSSPTAAGGAYTEFDGGARGETTWGNTLANVRDAADFVNATQWLPFDLEDEDDERLIFTNGWERGVDVYRYEGDLPKKLSRLQVSATADGGTVTGTLDRYAVLTYEGWKNLPLAGETIQVSVGGQTVQAVTDADGSFSASLALPDGTHTVTAGWEGDDRFAENEVTTAVTTR